MLATKAFKYLYTKLSQGYAYLNKLALSPENTKQLRTWGITEAAEMVGRSAQTLRNLEDQDKITKPIILSKAKREDRRYTLKHINELRDHFGTRPNKPENFPPAILCFVNFKGGAGKTTTAVNCSQYFALKGYRVLLIDCDSQGSATHMFGFNPDEVFDENQTILNILTDENKDISNYVVKTYWDGLDLVPANLSLYNAELALPSKIADEATKGIVYPFWNLLNNALKPVYDNYDIVLLDCPPSMGMITINALWAANMLGIGMPPVTVDFASTTQFTKMVYEVLERLPEKNYEFIKVFTTKNNTRNAADGVNKLLKKYIPEFFMVNSMIETEAIRTAASNLQTLYEMDKGLTDKKTYERAINCANALYQEFENSILEYWNNQSSSTDNVLIEDIAEAE